MLSLRVPSIIRCLLESSEQQKEGSVPAGPCIAPQRCSAAGSHPTPTRSSRQALPQPHSGTRQLLRAAGPRGGWAMVPLEADRDLITPPARMVHGWFPLRAHAGQPG